MANQPETGIYAAGVYQLETADPVLGGVGGLSNHPLLDLANRTGYLKTHVDALEAAVPLLAPKASPTFTGTVIAPTPSAGDSSTKVATTAFIQNRIGAPTTVNVAGNSNVTLTSAQYGCGLILFTGALTGNINVIFPASGSWTVENNTSGAFTITAKTSGGSGVLISQGASNIIVSDGTNIDFQFNDFANVALTGNPTAPTQSPGDNSTKVSNTAFVAAAISTLAPLASPAFTGNPTAPTQAGGNNSTRLATTAFVQTAISPLAPTASPTFTGNPAAPTQSGADNSTKLATTAFVQGAVTGLAPLANPTFTGNPAAPTQSPGDNTTNLATTAFVQSAVGSVSTSPIGTIIMWPATLAGGPPTNYLECNGASLSRTTYAALFAVLGGKYGGSGSNFTIPDMRGYFVRGWQSAGGIDAGRVFPSTQTEMIGPHTHGLTYGSSNSGNSLPGHGDTSGNTATTDSGTGTETRPVNVVVMYCIKYQ